MYINHRLHKKIILLLIFFGFHFHFVSQERQRKNDIVDFDFNYDTSILLELNHIVIIGLTTKHRNGKIKKTIG